MAKLKSFIDFIDECVAFAAENTVTKLIQKILDDTHYIESLSDGTEEGVARVENVQELLSKAVDFESKNEVKTLAAFLEEVALVADIDNYEENADSVALMTLHSAKGLEFNTVFIVGAEENIFPSARSTFSADSDDLEEERRLCYVGFTRARKSLYITYAVSRMQFGQTVNNNISRFIKEVPRSFIENITPGKKASSSINQKAFQGFTSPSQALPSAGGSASPSQAQPTAGGNASPNQARPAARGNASPIQPSAKSFSSPYQSASPKQNNASTQFKVGERVRQPTYGIGRIIAIREKSGDQEVSVAFNNAGIKKFMSSLANLDKILEDAHTDEYYAENNIC